MGSINVDSEKCGDNIANLIIKCPHCQRKKYGYVISPT